MNIAQAHFSSKTFHKRKFKFKQQNIVYRRKATDNWHYPFWAHKQQFAGPYDLCDAESSHKNRIYWITQNVTDINKFCMYTSKVGQYKMRYGLVSVNIKLQKYHLNMNPACSACLCEWMAQTRGFVYYWSARDAQCFQPLQPHFMSTWTHKQSLELLWESLHEQFTVFLSKTIVISYTNRNLKVKQPVKIKVWFNLKKRWQKYSLT